MMRSLYSGVSGLKNHQTRMDVVGNNISNVNTTGFKSSRVTFSDTLSQTLSGASAPTENRGGTNPKQIGLGSATSSIDTLFTDGSVQSTGVNTDLCLSGNGLFIVNNGNQRYYTRNGNFKFDAQGYYVNSDGLKVQGWCAKTPGDTYDTKAQPGEIRIQSGENMMASATKKAELTKNLNSAEATISGLKVTDKKGNVITTTDKSTGSWTVGPYNSPIKNLQVGFQGTNMSTVGTVKGSYAMGTTYQFNTALSATTKNGDSINIPQTSNDTYKVGTNLSSFGVKSVNGTTLTLDNGCTLTNNSGTSCNISLANQTNADTISSLNVQPAKANYSKVGTVTLTVTNVSGKTVSLSDGQGNVFTLTNNSNTDYWDGTTQPQPANPVRTITTTVQNIKYNSTDVIDKISGQVNGDTVEMTNGSVVPNNGLTVSNLTLDVDNATIAIDAKDTTAYKAGDDYTSEILSITLNMSDGTTSTETSGTYTLGNSKPLTTLMTVYDSLGNQHDIVLYLTKTMVDSTIGNQWTASVNPDGSGVQELVGADGKITTVAMEDTVIQFNTNGGYAAGAGTSTLTLTNGAAGTQNINMDFTGMTQYSGSNTAFASADGNAAGTLKSISIDSNGVITGTYTNGLNVARGQVAIAQFNNAAGLTKTGNSLYTKSNNSGEPNHGTISDLGCTVTPSSLEMSNVDMASELTDMIVTQRGYQSNSKIITVSDELLETLINMKR